MSTGNSSFSACFLLSDKKNPFFLKKVLTDSYSKVYTKNQGGKKQNVQEIRAMKKQIRWNYFRIAAAALCLAVALIGFSGKGGISATLLHGQFGPVLMKCLAAFSIGTLITLLAIVSATFLFGRFYCAALCPFGILQDFIGFLSRRKGKTTANFMKTRYLIAGFAFGMLISGWATPFLLLDPYSNSGRIVGSFSIGSMIPLAVIAVLAVWKKRIYCTAVCPVGTLLGLTAKYGVFRLRLSDQCVKCGMCVKVCPSGCIDPENGTLDNERCVRCMNCISVCRLHAVKFGRTERKALPVDETRRAFLVNSGILIAGFAAGTVLAKAGMKKLSGFAGFDQRRLPVQLQPLFPGLPDRGDPSVDAGSQTENQNCGSAFQPADLHRLSGRGKVRQMRRRLPGQSGHSAENRRSAAEHAALYRMRRLPTGLPGAGKGNDRS